jgi:hypothetical protein
MKLGYIWESDLLILLIKFENWNIFRSTISTSIFILQVGEITNLPLPVLAIRYLNFRRTPKNAPNYWNNKRLQHKH